MANGNNVTVVGNATRDPELKFTPSGTAVATFGVAVNRRWQNRQTSEWDEETSFFDVTVWQQLAENVAATIAKGSRVVVSGRLDQRSWETQDGEKRSKVEIVADEVSPSLRYATAEVTRNPRDDRDSPNGSGQGRQTGGQRAATVPTGAPPDYDDAPF